MTYTESCRCGAVLTISGWGIRDVSEPVVSFRQLHEACRRNKASNNSTPASLGLPVDSAVLGSNRRTP